MLIHVIVPSYDSPEFLNDCLHSLHRQDLPRGDFRVVVIDDASPDPEHGDVMRLWCERNGWRTITNTENRAAPYTIKQGIEASGAAPDDIIYLLDGDDRLNGYALRHAFNIYNEAPDTLLTYGDYSPEPDEGQTHASDYPTLVRRNREFREHPIGRFNHPITFRRRLWDALDDSDLQFDDGVWFRAAYDVALMMPMLEMAGPDRYVFSDRQTYIYNSLNPLSEYVAKPQLGDEVHRVVRSRPKKAMLP